MAIVSIRKEQIVIREEGSTSVKSSNEAPVARPDRPFRNIPSSLPFHTVAVSTFMLGPEAEVQSGDEKYPIQYVLVPGIGGIVGFHGKDMKCVGSPCPWGIMFCPYLVLNLSSVELKSEPR
jgi:hypothetical protein